MVLPVGFRPFDVLPLGGFITTTEQDVGSLALLPEIYPMARSVVNPYFTDSFANRLDIFSGHASLHSFNLPENSTSCRIIPQTKCPLHERNPSALVLVGDDCVGGLVHSRHSTLSGRKHPCLGFVQQTCWLTACLQGCEAASRLDFWGLKNALIFQPRLWMAGSMCLARVSASERGAAVIGVLADVGEDAVEFVGAVVADDEFAAAAGVVVDADFGA